MVGTRFERMYERDESPTSRAYMIPRTANIVRTLEKLRQGSRRRHDGGRRWGSVCEPHEEAKQEQMRHFQSN